MKSGMGTEFLEVRGDHVTGHGEFIESMENGLSGLVGGLASRRQKEKLDKKGTY
jgi:hypothetical protein